MNGTNSTASSSGKKRKSTGIIEKLSGYIKRARRSMEDTTLTGVLPVSPKNESSVGGVNSKTNDKFGSVSHKKDLTCVNKGNGSSSHVSASVSTFVVEEDAKSLSKTVEFTTRPVNNNIYTPRLKSAGMGSSKSKKIAFTLAESKHGTPLGKTQQNASKFTRRTLTPHHKWGRSRSSFLDAVSPSLSRQKARYQLTGSTPSTAKLHAETSIANVSSARLIDRSRARSKRSLLLTPDAKKMPRQVNNKTLKPIIDSIKESSRRLNIAQNDQNDSLFGAPPSSVQKLKMNRILGSNQTGGRRLLPDIRTLTSGSKSEVIRGRRNDARSGAFLQKSEQENEMKDYWNRETINQQLKVGIEDKRETEKAPFKRQKVSFQSSTPSRSVGNLTPTSLKPILPKSTPYPKVALGTKDQSKMTNKKFPVKVTYPKEEIYGNVLDDLEIPFSRSLGQPYLEAMVKKTFQEVKEMDPYPFISMKDTLGDKLKNTSPLPFNFMPDTKISTKKGRSSILNKSLDSPVHVDKNKPDSECTSSTTPSNSGLGWGNVFSQKAVWKCSDCFVSNPMDTSVCLACAAQRPNADCSEGPSENGDKKTTSLPVATSVNEGGNLKPLSFGLKIPIKDSPPSNPTHSQVLKTNGEKKENSSQAVLEAPKLSFGVVPASQKIKNSSSPVSSGRFQFGNGVSSSAVFSSKTEAEQDTCSKKIQFGVGTATSDTVPITSDTKAILDDNHSTESKRSVGIMFGNITAMTKASIPSKDETSSVKQPTKKVRSSSPKFEHGERVQKYDKNKNKVSKSSSNKSGVFTFGSEATSSTTAAAENNNGFSFATPSDQKNIKNVNTKEGDKAPFSFGSKNETASKDGSSIAGNSSIASNSFGSKNMPATNSETNMAASKSNVTFRTNSTFPPSTVPSFGPSTTAPFNFGAANSAHNPTKVEIKSISASANLSKKRLMDERVAIQPNPTSSVGFSFPTSSSATAESSTFSFGASTSTSTPAPTISFPSGGANASNPSSSNFSFAPSSSISSSNAAPASAAAFTFGAVAPTPASSVPSSTPGISSFNFGSNTNMPAPANNTAIPSFGVPNASVATPAPNIPFPSTSQRQQPPPGGNNVFSFGAPAPVAVTNPSSFGGFPTAITGTAATGLGTAQVPLMRGSGGFHIGTSGGKTDKKRRIIRARRPPSSSGR